MTKIKYNMENKNSIISNLNGCISKLSVINNNFYNTYFPRDFYYINSLFSMERELITIKKDLNNYKDNINEDKLVSMAKGTRINKVNKDVGPLGQAGNASEWSVNFYGQYYKDEHIFECHREL